MSNHPFKKPERPKQITGSHTAMMMAKGKPVFCSRCKAEFYFDSIRNHVEVSCDCFGPFPSNNLETLKGPASAYRIVDGKIVLDVIVISVLDFNKDYHGKFLG